MNNNIKDKIKVLISEEKIESRLEELAKEIEIDYKNKDIIFICILKGATYFAIELSKKISNNVILEFMKVSSYGDSTISSGKIKMSLDIEDELEGKDVIIVEDILDTGNTLKYLKEYLSTKKPKSLKICTMLNKPERKIVDIDADYVGFEIPNKFVVGYGLDYNENYRNLPYIGYIET